MNCHSILLANILDLSRSIMLFHLLRYANSKIRSSVYCFWQKHFNPADWELYHYCITILTEDELHFIMKIENEILINNCLIA